MEDEAGRDLERSSSLSYSKTDLQTNLLTDACLTGNQTSQLPKAISLTALPILH